MTEEGLGNGEARSDAFAADVFKDMSAVTIDAGEVLWTPASGKTIRLLGGYISADDAVSVLFNDDTALLGDDIPLVRTPVLVADTPYWLDLGPKGILLSGADRVVAAISSAAADITGTLYGVET